MWWKGKNPGRGHGRTDREKGLGHEKWGEGGLSVNNMVDCSGREMYQTNHELMCFVHFQVKKVLLGLNVLLYSASLPCELQQYAQNVRMWPFIFIP